ncbi:MAG: ROK family protein [Candidatus Woesearchaeota archaeon]|nr:ROK family protein [Candidatus Woesearchaeota archaeon]
MLIEVYDVGGSKLRGAFAMLTSRVLLLERMEEPTRPDFYNQILEMSPKLRKTSVPSCVSVSVPGPVDGKTLIKVPQLNLSNPINLEEKLSSLGPIHVENDVNAAAYAELNEGIGKEYNNFYVLTLSTGIGAGIVLNGNVIGGNSGEFGHCVLETDPQKLVFVEKCGCKNKGCWCSFSSGNGLSYLAGLFVEKGLDCEDLFYKAKRGNESAKKIIKEAREYNAHGIGNMVSALDVEAISIMGSLGLNQFDLIIPSKQEISKYTLNNVPKITKTKFGEDIGLIGAFYSAKSFF